MHYQNSITAIVSGAFLGVFNYFMTGGGLEIINVFMFGLLGGAGGYIGKLLVQKLHIYFNDKKP